MRKSREKIKWFVVLLLGVVLIGAVIGLANRIDKNEKTKVLGLNAYQIGMIDSTGVSPKKSATDYDNSGISTKEFYKVDNLKIEVKDNSNVKYWVNYYDENKEFISTSSAFTGDFSSSEVPTTAKFVKIELKNLDDSDGVVSLFEVPSISKLISVTVNK